MSYKVGNRNQIIMFPPSIEDSVSVSDPVRAYDALIDALDLNELGVRMGTPGKGCPAYPPLTMLKLLVYGYSYGWRSSRKLERAIYHNISFIWLMSGLKPDHKTIAQFRKNNKKALKKVMTQLSKICIELNLIEGNTLFLDGSKVRGNASINQTKSKEWLKKQLDDVENKIDKIFKECDQIDNAETGSYVELPKELQDAKKLKKKITKALKKIKEEDKKKINLTDNDCVNFRGRQGSHAGYNAQIVVDEKYGLIVNSDVVNKNNDLNLFSQQIEKANDILNKNCENACADAGYSNTKNLKESVDKGINVVVPTQKQSRHKSKEENPFEKSNFKYDEENNQYICPEGHTLRFSHYSKINKQYLYRMSRSENCRNCKYYKICTKSKRGRAIIRLKDENTKLMLEKSYKTAENQMIYKKRKEKVELPFGHIKRNLNGGYFLLRGLAGVNAEMAINTICFNMSRMLTIFGSVPEFIKQLANVRKREIIPVI